MGFTACVTSAEIRKEFAYVWDSKFAPLRVPFGAKVSVMRSITWGRKLLFAPWRSWEPISSSSKTPTSLMRPSSSPVEDVEARSAFDRGPGADFVVDSAAENEFFFKTTGLCGLSVVKF